MICVDYSGRLSKIGISFEKADGLTVYLQNDLFGGTDDQPALNKEI